MEQQRKHAYWSEKVLLPMWHLVGGGVSWYSGGVTLKGVLDCMPRSVCVIPSIPSSDPLIPYLHDIISSGRGLDEESRQDEFEQHRHSRGLGQTCSYQSKCQRSLVPSLAQCSSVILIFELRWRECFDAILISC